MSAREREVPMRIGECFLRSFSHDYRMLACIFTLLGLHLTIVLRFAETIEDEQVNGIYNKPR